MSKQLSLGLLCAALCLAGVGSCAVSTRAEERRSEPTSNVARSEYVVVSGENADALAQECDQIIKRLEARYGKPRYWRPFPVRFAPGKGGNVAGYTSYVCPNVLEVAIFQTPDEARGGALDHELTHAFFFYYLRSNFNLLLNEGLAQNSEYANRARLRENVWRRFESGDFASLRSLYQRRQYDANMLIYCQGFSAVDFLIGRGGSKWFAAFVDDLTNGSQDLTTALKRFYGYDGVDEWEDAWLEFVVNGQERAAVRAVR